MLKHSVLKSRLTYLFLVSLFISVLSGCSSEYSTIGPGLEGKKSITGGKMSLLAGKPGGSGSSDAVGTLSRFNEPSGITVYGNNLYVADKNNNTIRKIDLYTKAVSTIAGYPRIAGVNDGIGVNARFNKPWGIAADGVYLYVADSSNRVIRKIKIDTGEVVTLAGRRGQAGITDGAATTAAFRLPAGLTIMDDMLYIADTDSNTIRRVDKNSGQTVTVAGTANTSGKRDGTGKSALFTFPYGIANDGNYLYIADTYNHTIRRMNPNTGEVITLTGKAGQSGFANGSLSEALFYRPSGLSIKGGELFVSEIGNDLVRVIDLTHGTVSTIAGTTQFYGPSDGPPGVGKFNSPIDMVMAGDFLYVADKDNNSIRSVNISTGEIATLAGAPSYKGSVDDSALNSRFNIPWGVALDGGALYVADTSNNTIRKVDVETGAVTTIAGTAGVAGATDSTESLAVFNGPTDVITDENGEFIYIVDTENHIIRSMNISTGEVRTFAGFPAIPGKLDGVGTSARFNLPKRGVRIKDKLYITETGNHVIRVIDILTRRVTTLAGEIGVSGSIDSRESNTGTARFRSPGDITTDGTFLYVADTGNHAIRRVDPNTRIVNTIAGTRGGSGIVDSIDGPPLFNSPEGITYQNGILYISDTGNHIIRKLNLSTMQVSLLAGDVSCTEETDIVNDEVIVKKTCEGQNSGLSAYGDSTDGTGKTTSFNSPTGINAYGSYLYVMDTGSNRIRRVHIDTGETKTFSFSQHKGVALNSPAGGDLAGNILYFADRGNQVIRKLDITGIDRAPLILIAGNLRTTGYVYSAGYSASFFNPVGIVADGMGNLYVSDTGNHTIRKVVIATGEVTTIAGVPTRPGFVNSEFGSPMFNFPRGICIIGDHLYVADSGNHLVRRINLITGYVGLAAGLSDYVTSTGAPGTADSTGAAAGFNDPRGITTDGKYLYVADSGNHTIRRVLAATGQVRTIAGMPEEAGYKDGISFDARFNFPMGITVDGDYLYVADSGNNVLRRFNKNTGEVLTFSGKMGDSSFIEGSRENARYNNVVSVATSPETPYIYFIDSAENVVGKIEK